MNLSRYTTGKVLKHAKDAVEILCNKGYVSVLGNPVSMKDIGNYRLEYFCNLVKDGSVREVIVK